MRREVELLLSHDATQGMPIDNVVREAAHELARENSEWLVGKQVGVYQVTGLVGEGGMGAVYKAVRNDDHFRKEVALKVVRHGAETQSLLRRFRSERQILAALDHPYIARLLDGGATPEGLPYFVMELIDGVSITSYVRQNRLTVDARLELFRKVCEAVQYAHSKLVVHRDLKPANILITPNGTPRLLDFGIAKLLTAEDGLPVADVTATLRLLTPYYASPEQVRGSSVGTSTDVYSLGAILYEVLTGRHPIGSEGQTPVEITAAVCTQDPSPPSRSLELDSATRRSLSGDLDNIVLMALRKEPERRYRSVEQFSEDISRYLRGHPVIARAPTFSYRATKFVGRNRIAVGAAALAAISLIAGAGVAVFEARRAERRFQQVRKLANTFLFSFHDQIEHLAGSTPAREFVVKTALEYLDSLASESGNDVALQTELATAYLRVAHVQGNPRAANLGQSDAALVSLSKAIQIAESLARRQPANAAALRILATAYSQQGDLIGSVKGDPAQSLSALRKAVDAGERLVRLSNASLEDWTSRAGHLLQLGDGLLDEAPKEAKAAWEQGLLSAKRADAIASSAPTRRTVAQALQRMGRVSHELGDPAAAVDYLHQSEKIIEELHNAYPDDVRYFRELSILYILLGNNTGNPGYFNLEKPAEAIAYYEKAAAVQRQLTAKDPKDARARLDEVFTAIRLTQTYIPPPGPQTVAQGRRCLAMLDQMIARTPNDTRMQRIRRNCVSALSRVLAETGKPLELIPRLEETLQEARKEAMAGPKDIVRQAFLNSALEDLAYAHLLARQWTQAQQYLEQASTLLQRLHRELPNDLYFARDLAVAQEYLGRVHQGRADTAKASASYKDALKTWNEWRAAAQDNIYVATRIANIEARLRSLNVPHTIQ
ncbi:MAG: protein kinase [Acidobacteria bacterium]|nr:protein kinase [Acidobacteriota bacterium]